MSETPPEECPHGAWEITGAEAGIEPLDGGPYPYQQLKRAKWDRAHQQSEGVTVDSWTCTGCGLVVPA